MGELTELVGQPQNAVSYHLSRLRAGGLVSTRRSSADGRDNCDRIELTRCAQVLAAPVRLLFLCTGNSSRSQIAEALLQRAAGTRVRVASDPKPVHPNTLRVMHEYGIDVTGRRSKHLDTLAGRQFDYVITLCDKVREVWPEFRAGTQAIHWSIPDPAAEGSGRASYPAFRAVAADLHSRIGFFAQAIAPTHEAMKGNLS